MLHSMPSSQPASSGLPSCSLEGNFIKWFLRQHQLFKRLPGGAEKEDNACKESSSDQNGSNLFPNGDRPIHHAFFWRRVEEDAERFCCAQHRRELWIQPIVCFQIHFEFLSPKLERKKLQIEFLSALACPPLPGGPAVPSSANSSASFLLKLRV